jgi:hypothetical protein
MTADLSRVTFDPAKRFSGVVYQQGRVILDADLNEEHEIESYLAEATASDVIGPSGAPKASAGGGFHISVTSDGANLVISPGRFYVDGILCELTPTEVPIEAADAQTMTVAIWHLDGHDLDVGQWVEILLPGQTSGEVQRVSTVEPTTRTLTLSDKLTTGTPGPGSRLRRVTTYDTQPDSFALLADVTAASGAGRYRVYLDVWERVITQIEDDSVRESALGGADTAARTKIVWQVRAELAGPVSQGDCATLFEGQWEPAAPTGTLLAEVDPGSAGGPCVLPPASGFTGLQNQLYRVQARVDKSDGTLTGNSGDPDVSFMWQPDNASVEVQVESFGQTTIVSSLGKDASLGLANNQTVEALDDYLELAGKPGELFTITVNEEQKQVTFDRAPHYMLDLSAHPKLRQWDGQGAIQPPPTPQTWAPLEKGLQVQFAGDTFRNGDYWLIPARTATSADVGTIDWPLDDGGQPLAKEPDGIRHYYAPLALVDFDGTKFLPAAGSQLLDCRAVFPAITAITAADVSYDGSVCALGGAVTVQQAIEALCAGSKDMCTVHISPGAGWEAAFAQIAAGQDAQICFEIGDYQASETIALTNTGHLTVTGCGPGTTIEAPHKEAVFRFTGCPSVTVRDLSVTGGIATTATDEKGLLGALTFSSCSQVRVEDVELSCAGQASRTATCISVKGNLADSASSVRIEHCDLTVGQHQAGILITDTARVLIDDNIIRTAAQPFSSNVADWMNNATLRGSIRDLLIRAPQVTAAAQQSGPVVASARAVAAPVEGPVVTVLPGRGRNPATVTVQGLAHQITFTTIHSIASAVAAVLHQNPASARLNTQAVAEHLRSVIDRALKQNPAIVGGERLFQWAGSVVAQNPVVCDQGIVVAGQSAPEVRILRNTITGAMQGIHVGLSHRGAVKGANDMAGRVMIRGNKLEIRLPVIGLRDRHAIFAGSTDSLLIDNNYGTMATSTSAPVDAVRVLGMLGRQAIVRENHFKGFTVGFKFQPLNNPTATIASQWMIVDNVAANASPVVQIVGQNPGRVNASNNLA